MTSQFSFSDKDYEGYGPLWSQVSHLKIQPNTDGKYSEILNKMCTEHKHFSCHYSLNGIVLTVSTELPFNRYK